MVRLLVASVLLAAAAAPAVAQPAAPSFSYGKADDVKDVQKVTWTATAEAGVVVTTGNSRSTTVTGTANATRKDPHNKLAFTATGAYARATTRTATDFDGDMVIDPGELGSVSSTSTKNASAKARYDRYLTNLNSVYAAVLAATDVPAGKRFQGGLQAGYSRSLYKTECGEANAELGYDYSYLRLVTGETTTIHSLRAFIGYKGKLRGETGLEASGEGLFNGNTIKIGGREAGAFEDARLTGILAVTTKLHKKVALNVSFTAKYEGFPAPLGKIGALPFAPGFVPLSDKVDTISKLSLIVTFL